MRSRWAQRQSDCLGLDEKIIDKMGDMDDLNKIKELLEEKYNAVIFTNLEKYLNENKDEFYPEHDYYNLDWDLSKLLLKEYEIIRVSYTDNLEKKELEIIIRSEITEFSEWDLGADISITELFRIVANLDEKNDCFEVVYIGLCMENVII